VLVHLYGHVVVKLVRDIVMTHDITAHFVAALHVSGTGHLVVVSHFYIDWEAE